MKEQNPNSKIVSWGESKNRVRLLFFFGVMCYFTESAEKRQYDARERMKIGEMVEHPLWSI